MFFNADPALDFWNEEYARWELETNTHGLYWKELDDGSILVISCFHV